MVPGQGQAVARFADRRDAGRALAERLSHHAGRDDVVVLGLPRGGVPVAAAVADALDAPLDVLIVRKVGVPDQPELALGAVAEGGVALINEDVQRIVRPDPLLVEQSIQRERTELERRLTAYRTGRPAIPLAGKIVILVDDGLATGASMEAAVHALRQRQPARIVVAVPVASREALRRLAGVADEAVAALVPASFQAVGAWYLDFTQTEDREVEALLAAAGPRHH